MSQLEECRAQAEKLRGRIREYQAGLDEETDPQRRSTLRVKLTSLRAALKDVQVQIDHLDPPAVRKARRQQRKRLDVGALSWDFFERSGAVWSDLEGHTWNQAEAGDPVELGTGPEQLQAWLAEGAQRLTQRQRLYIDAYYNRGVSLERIAQEYGIDKSTVAQVVKNGLARMREWVEAKRLIAACADGKGGFDWARYLLEGRVLTPRQRQLVLLVLSGLPRTQKELASRLELEQSTVSRTLAAAGRVLRRLETPQGRPGRRPEIQDWAHAGPWELARQAGISLGEYYRLCKGRVHGLTRYRWELYRRMRAGYSAQETARELGLSLRIVRANWSSLRTQEKRGMLHAGP